MRFVIASALLASAAIATPALAQDAPASAPEGKEFQGFKILAVTGIDRVTSSIQNETGLTYGGVVGYDVQSGNAVFGVEGEIDGSTAKDCANNVIAAGDRVCVKAGRDLYAGVRAGVVVGNKALLYVKGGYANGRITGTYTAGGVTTKDSGNSDGWRVGTGVELPVAKNMLVRAEYRYTNYSDTDLARHQGVIGFGVKF
ncbi:outer membrane protein [Sphingomonas asaccharolytica]|uniref:outer membrane protein n=1 Tax=Sphingomonas asaccharolytica TaxID=40681 RepID=UPI00082E11BE|nr:outer membrane beta-barrel protein [Sphingomonas asaccharolytica]